MSTARSTSAEIVYPEDNGEPLAENTLQFEWIVTIKEGLDDLFRDDPDVFVAGDLLWYPVEGDPSTCVAPDAMVAFGRPKGFRGSYRQWDEGGIAPQVVFEVLSPGNRAGEMLRKLRFYERFAVDEYYIYDPDDNTLEGWLLEDGAFREIAETDGWTSPRLGIRFDLSTGDRLRIIRPDGRPFLSYGDLALSRDHLEEELGQVAIERDRVAAERDQVAIERDEQRQRAEALAAKFRALGIDPDA